MKSHVIGPWNQLTWWDEEPCDGALEPGGMKSHVTGPWNQLTWGAEKPCDGALEPTNLVG
jgi:hypothetical protein